MASTARPYGKIAADLCETNYNPFQERHSRLSLALSEFRDRLTLADYLLKLRTLTVKVNFPMRRMFSVIYVAVAVLLVPSAAQADYEGSQNWFNRLTFAERTGIQLNLILTGYYSGLADGRFGRNTYAALIAFEQEKSIFANGVLSTIEAAMLVRAARDWLGQFAFREERVDAAGIVLPIPYGLVGLGEPTERGVFWEGRDSGFHVEAAGYDAYDTSLDELYDIFSGPASNSGVEYRARPQQQNFFVVSGRNGSRLYYMMFKANGDTVSGFVANWGNEIDGIGRRATLYMASKARHVPSDGTPLPPALRPDDATAKSTSYRP